jgi:hypothetical protein
MFEIKMSMSQLVDDELNRIFKEAYLIIVQNYIGIEDYAKVLKYLNKNESEKVDDFVKEKIGQISFDIIDFDDSKDDDTIKVTYNILINNIPLEDLN